MARGLLAAALTGVVLCLLAGCAPGSDRTADPLDVDMFAGSPSRSSTPNPLVRGVPPGRYFTSRFEPALDVEIADGWALQGETANSVAFQRVVGDQQTSVVVTHNSALVKDSRPYRVQGSDAGYELLGEYTDSVVGALPNVPELDVGPGPQVNVLGELRPSTLVASNVPGSPDGPCPAGIRCPNIPFPTVDLQAGWFLAPSEELLVVEIAGRDTTVMILGNLGHTEAMQIAAPFLDSFEVRPT